MSDQTQALERSALESKDRSELMTIATAMGGKPGSRTKKADLVDMIFELAGITPADESADAATEDGPADTSAAGSADQGSGDQTGADETSADETSVSEGGAVGSSADATGADEPGAPASSGGRGPRGGAATPAPQGSNRQARGRQDDEKPGGRQGGGRQGGDAQGAREGGRNGSDRGRVDADQDDPNRVDPNRADPNRADPNRADPNRADPNRADPNRAEGGDGNDPEPGNRRRRRRGRDRGGNAQDDQNQGPQEPVEVDGLLDLRDEGYGFLRVAGYLPSKDDVYVSVKQTRQFSLRKGDRITGASRPASRNEKNPALLRIDTVNGLDPDAARQRPKFDSLTPLFPDEPLRLESADEPYNMTRRIVDLVAPIGKGQRGMIVSPPKAGKTTIMKEIARSIEANHPDVHLIVLLVDERPEEVTDMRRSVDKSEVAASTFDRPPEEHVQVAELTIERAKRLVEAGRDVVIILDGITRLARAYNQVAPQSGRIMSGGVDAAALYPPKRIFGAARNLEEGGSLTILATALVETGSRMDEVIFEEFKGTGNMELKLDRRLAERRIFPAIDVDASSTRHEELLYEKKQLDQVWKLRRVLSGMAAESGSSGAGLELLVDRMKSFRDNAAFLTEVSKGGTGA